MAGSCRIGSSSGADWTSERRDARPVEEDDLKAMVRFSVEPDALGEFEWTGFTDPRTLRRRWEEDGLLGDDSSYLAVVTPDGTFAGVVNWRSPRAEHGARHVGVSSIPYLEFGIALSPSIGAKAMAALPKRRWYEYLFATTAVHHIQATKAEGNL